MLRKIILLLGTAGLLALLPAGPPPAVAAKDPGPAPYADRWVYAPFNLLDDRKVGQLISIIRRAGKSGYTGIVLADYKFATLRFQPPAYFKNLERVRRAAEDAKLEIIPAIFPIGYSNGLLAHDPNLAEGVPVKDAPFVVKGREAVLVPDPATRVVNGGLEEAEGDSFRGFLPAGGPGKTTFADREVAHGGKVSCRMQDVRKHDRRGMCLLRQKVKFRPYTCYRFSCWVKTRGLRPPRSFRLLVRGRRGRPLNYYPGDPPKPTQDWARIEVAFNSLNETEGEVSAGLLANQAGTVWVDDLRLEELALVNVLRRKGCPLVVASADGKTTYEEGRDYHPVRDDKLGLVPYRGEYRFSHAGPRLRLTEGSRIKDGERLRVSWYHPVLTQSTQVMCCLTDPKVYDLLEKQAAEVQRLFKPKTIFMRHDEVRVVNWCELCQSAHRTPGQLLAANVRRCVKIIQKVNPDARIVVWSDMFDPFHNAKDKYYFANGTLKGSWEGLPSSVTVCNWNGNKPRDSLKWFADRGHRQVVAGYYDYDPKFTVPKRDAARKGVPRVTGFMYATFAGKYDQLEAYGKALRERAGKGEP
jgi:hypothetical protein